MNIKVIINGSINIMVLIMEIVLCNFKKCHITKIAQDKLIVPVISSLLYDDGFILNVPTCSTRLIYQSAH